MATVGFLPGLFGITDWAKSEPANIAQANAVTRLLIALLLVRLLCRRLILLLVVGCLLQQIRLLLRQRGAHLQVLLPVEDDLSVDERRLDARVGRERMAVPDHDVRVLAGVNRADAVIEAELLRGIERAELQRFLFREAGV